LPVQPFPSKGSFNPEATVASWLRGRITSERAKEFNGESNRAGIVHRLDRTTSGVMICAKNEPAQRWLQKQFSTRNVKKTYIAIVAGHLKEKEAIIDMPIERNPAQPKTFRASNTGKPAMTHYKVLSETPKHSVLELQPTTGRTHQLRVHLRAIGHPIVGDTLYGGEAALRIYLHALELELTLPDHQRKVFSSPLPEEFSEEIS
jgi:23S rRNA pseudouridine1911/1915/1917 synthase